MSHALIVRCPPSRSRAGLSRRILLHEAAGAGRGSGPDARRRPSSRLEPTPAPRRRRRRVSRRTCCRRPLDEINRRGYLKDAFFELDRSGIEAAQRDALAGDATWLRAHPSVRATDRGPLRRAGNRLPTTWRSEERRAAAARVSISRASASTGRACRRSLTARSAPSRRPTTSPRGRRTVARTSS